VKEFQDKLNGLISGLPADGSTTNASLSWAKDETNYSLSISVNGGSISTSFSAYKPTVAVPAIPQTQAN
jgi:hypothetical protein